MLRLLLAALAALATLAPVRAQTTTSTGAGAQDRDRPNRRSAPFRVLDNVEGAWIDLVHAPVRPMALHPQTGNLFALNSHDSSVHEFAPDGSLVRSMRLPWGPVSVAVANGSGGAIQDQLLVVCRGTSVLVRVDLASGRIEQLIDLPAEPADLLVHPLSGNAFVSSQAMDSVVEVELAGGSIVSTWRIPSESPRHLAWLPNTTGGDVIVAPMLSGNNSVADEGNFILDPGTGRVLDLEDPTIASQGLPDHDLFRLIPGGGVEPLARDMGAVLFGLGVNPASGQVWQLGTEAHNKDAARQGEPAVRGDFVVNQLAIASVASGSVVEPARVRDLDDLDPMTPGVQFDPTRTVGQPVALAFDGAGRGYVTGLLTNNVTELNASGVPLREWDTGSIPRGILIREGGVARRAFVYCWGSNRVEEYDLLATPPALLHSLDLGFDPTPEKRKAGRELFYDASFSARHNASCNSCHVDGDTDMLPWDLSNLPFDDKGPLVTQTMRGIADLVPLHWRGERADLIDFNGAFDGLLGGEPLSDAPGGQFELFEEFIFSLEQPANPNEDRRRVVSAEIGYHSPDGRSVVTDAINGQDAYFDVTSVNGVGACNVCHTLPTGTNNDVVLDEPQLEEPRRNHFVVPAYNGVWRKEQTTLVDVVRADGSTETRPTIGAGLAASGIIDSLLDFVEIPLFSLSDKRRRDITAFVNQVDSGLAPAVHEALLLASPPSDEMIRELRHFYLPQADARNADLVVFGSIESGGGSRELRWSYDRASGLFEAEDSSVPAQDLAFFVDQARAGHSNVFLGLPVGMGERFGIDFDADDLRNGDELTLGTDPERADSDGDGDPDGHEVLNGGDPLDAMVGSSDSTAPVIENLRLVYATTRVAKLLFDTAEPTRFVADWSDGAQSGQVTSDLFEKKHTVLLRELRPNRLNTVTVTAIDHGGNQAAQAVPGGVRTLQVVFPFDVVFRAASSTVIQDSGGTLHLRIQGNARRKALPAFAAGIQIRADVFVNGVLTQEDATSTVSGSNGAMTLDVIETGLFPRDEVAVSIQALHDTNQNTSLFWSMPDTPPENREFHEVYTGVGP